MKIKSLFFIDLILCFKISPLNHICNNPTCTHFLEEGRGVPMIALHESPAIPFLSPFLLQFLHQVQPSAKQCSSGDAV